MNAQSFSCDGTFYISLNQSQAPTTFYEITTSGGINFDELFAVDLYLNAIGLSTEDKNIYAVELGLDNSVYQIQADGTATAVFSEPEINTWSAAAGAVNNNGVYAVHDRNLDMIFLYQTGATFTKLGSTTLFWDASTGNSGIFDHNIDDLVFDPFDDSVMYTYQRFWDTNGPENTRGHLLRVNVDMASPDFGMVTSVGQLDPTMLVHLGSMFFDTNGALHGYGALSSSPIVQDRLLKINQNNATLELLGTGPQASGVDGCSCRNPMILTKTVELLETSCDSNLLKYTLEVENLSMLETATLKLKDTLQFDGTIQNIDVSNFPAATITSGGVGTDHFILEDFSTAGSSVATMSFEVLTPLADQTVLNQARLYESEGAPIDSDNPLTIEISDATDYELPALMGGETDLSFDICEDNAVIINGVTYDMAGMFVDTISVDGCDSILNIAINVLENSIRNETVDLCPGENIVINGITYDSAGTFTQELTNSVGCDSTFNLIVTVSDCNDCTDYSNITNSFTIVKSSPNQFHFAQKLGDINSSKNLNSMTDLENNVMNYLGATYPRLSERELKISCQKIIDSVADLKVGNEMSFK